MSKSKPAKAQRTASVNAAKKDERAASETAKQRALCTEVLTLSKLVNTQVSRIANDINEGNQLLANSYEIAKGNLANLVKNVNKLSLYLPRAKKAESAKPAKSEGRKAAKPADVTIEDDPDAPEDDGDDFEEGV